MKVTSKSLSNGVWNEKITNTSYGENVSPELTWSAVDGAAEYAVYMVDPDGHNWLHWRVTGFQGTHLDEGEMPDGSGYVGPYPPSGTHRYIVTVYALKAKPDSIPGNFDSSNASADKIEKALNIVKRQIVSGENGALFSTISPLNGILFSVTARSWRKKRHAVRRLIP